MKKQPKKQSFVQDVDPFRKQILLITGVKSTTEILKHAKKHRVDKEFYEFIKSKVEKTDEILREDCAFCLYDDKMKTLIVLREYEDSWYFWETLMHELYHFVKALFVNIAGIEEEESQAYTQEHLFRTIRRKLMGVDKK